MCELVSPKEEAYRFTSSAGLPRPPVFLLRRRYVSEASASHPLCPWVCLVWAVALCTCPSDPDQWGEILEFISIKRPVTTLRLAGQPKRGLVARQPPSSVSITHWLRFNSRRVLSTASASEFRASEISSVVMLRCSASSEMIDAPSSRPIQRAYTLVYWRAA